MGEKAAPLASSSPNSDPRAPGIAWLGFRLSCSAAGHDRPNQARQRKQDPAQPGEEPPLGGVFLRPGSDRGPAPDRSAGPVLHHEPALPVARLSERPARPAPLPSPPPESGPHLQEVERPAPKEAAPAHSKAKGRSRPESASIVTVDIAKPRTETS